MVAPSGMFYPNSNVTESVHALFGRAQATCGGDELQVRMTIWNVAQQLTQNAGLLPQSNKSSLLRHAFFKTKNELENKALRECVVQEIMELEHMIAEQMTH